jgi:Ca-activated chloride channel family protein
MTQSRHSSNMNISAVWERPVVPERGGNATLVVRIDADQIQTGQRRAPIDVAFVLDRSGSMSGEKIELVKQAVSTAVSLLHDDDRAALVIYDNEVECLQPLAPATSRMKAALRLALHGVDARGSTYLSGGWLAGCDLLASGMNGSDRSRVRRSLLLTDGQANAGIVDPAELAKHAGELRRRGIGTTALGAGADYDELLLSGMSEAGGGNFTHIQRPDQLPAFFQEEIGELMTLVAASLTLSITLPHGVRARLVNAFPCERTGKRIDVAVGEIPAGNELRLVFDVTVEKGRVGTVLPIGIALSWTDPAADLGRTLNLVVPPLAIVSKSDYERTAVDATVQEEAALERANAAQREAMRLDRAGRHAESRAYLRSSSAVLAAAPQSARVMGMAMELDALAEVDEDRAYDTNVHKQVTYEAMRRSRGKQDGTPSR